VSWLGYALLSALFAGLVGILGKIGVKGVDSTVATMLRALVMAGVMVAMVGALGTWKQAAHVPRGPMIFIVLSGLAGALSWVFYFRALQMGQAAQVAPIDRLSGVVTLVLAIAFLGERVSPAVIGGSLLMVLGGLLVAKG
jgi:transporter family protein